MNELLIILLPALIGAVPALIVAINTNRLIAYRVDELAKKIEENNRVVERIYKIESDMNTMWQRHDELKEQIREIKKSLKII